MRPLYQFSGQDSFLHHLDPRTKLIFVVSYLLISFLVPQPWVLFFLLILAIWALAGISPAEYYPFILLMLPIMAAIALVHTFLIEGAPYLWSTQLGPVRVGASGPGLRVGLDLGFRLGTMGLAFTLFAMTTEPFQWGMAMYRWGLPYKVAFMFAFAIRLYPLIQEEFMVIQRALRARGSNALGSFNPLIFFPGVVTAAVPLGLSAIRRSQDIAMAMELRGLNLPEETGRPRVLFREVRLRPIDLLIMAGCLAVLGALLGLRLSTHVLG
ncbi:MAG TPA: energy-coupling factor transporter transmembrane component T [Candidatus Dormibacteraeota bacterium]|nr:energy-coupling factor transporter transmembrane component T [Candidatus Dormibacteraeota bacterium]